MRDLVRVKVLVPTFAAALVLAACGSSSSKTNSSSGTQAAATNSSATTTVRTASSSLGTILVNTQGMTLYHLSAEQGRKFICTSAACVGIWHPLTVAAGTTPSGAGGLGTVKRPDGTTQVTYNGSPLYTFAQDHGAGETTGQGVKDVGTWMAATTGAASTSTPAPEKSTTEKSGGGYAY